MRNLLVLAIIVLASCKPQTKSYTAQEVIDQSIIASGTDKVATSTISFKFRKGHYKATRNNGEFLLEGDVLRGENRKVIDSLSNRDFTRYINGEKFYVPDSLKVRYSGSVNSVHYFSVLPFGLNDKAVKKKLLDEVNVKGKSYYKVRVSFSEEGGGEDFDDIFIYWVRKDNFLIDYLAYSYRVNGGGMRFREATNERVVNGIRFVDYNNYKAKNASTKLENLDKAFEKSELKKLSEINLENVQVVLN